MVVKMRPMLLNNAVGGIVHINVRLVHKVSITDKPPSKYAVNAQ
jgi:hypothetical protein